MATNDDLVPGFVLKGWTCYDICRAVPDTLQYLESQRKQSRKITDFLKFSFFHHSRMRPQRRNSINLQNY